MTETRFRKLLWTYIALSAAAIIAAAFPSYSDQLQAAVHRESNSWLWHNDWAAGAVFGAFAVAWVVGLVGLFRFRPWGRSISLYSTLAGLAVYPFLGNSLSSAWEDVFYESSMMLWGAILALAYYSPVSARFGR